MRYRMEDTIAAIATPSGEGGIAIIRVSGPSSIEQVQPLFSGNIASYPSHTAHFGYICHQGERVDGVLLLVMKGRSSYTGETTVEIHAHGGAVAASLILELVLQQGARPAGPGEFTYRALLNGKIDLAQAEAVQTLIGAKNRQSFLYAQKNLQGALSQQVKEIKEKLIHAAATIEGVLDFPDEVPEHLLGNTIETIKKQLHQLIATYDHTQKVFQGIDIGIIGFPNVGKSSLLNALLGYDRAIVTPIAGTTRDMIDAPYTFGSVPCRLIDTAGLRISEDRVEQIGIQQSYDLIHTVDIVLFVIDATQGLSPEEEAILRTMPQEKVILVANKRDLHPSYPGLAVSAKTKEGLEELSNTILQKIRGYSSEEVVLTSAHQKHCLLQALEAIDTLHSEYAVQGCQLKEAAAACNEMIGGDVTEEVLDAIFSTFCVGK